MLPKHKADEDYTADHIIRDEIRRAVLAEREACAKVAETIKAGSVYLVNGYPNAIGVIGGEVIAEAIRARE